MSIGAGRFNRKIDIEQRTGAVDELNQPTNTWELVTSVWANVKTVTGMGSIRGAQEGVTRDISPYSFRIRYKPTGVNAGMRVSYDGVFYDIVAVRHDVERREWTDLVCERGGNDG